jgi:hypothetical protein
MRCCAVVVTLAEIKFTDSSASTASNNNQLKVAYFLALQVGLCCIWRRGAIYICTKVLADVFFDTNHLSSHEVILPTISKLCIYVSLTLLRSELGKFVWGEQFQVEFLHPH